MRALYKVAFSYRAQDVLRACAWFQIPKMGMRKHYRCIVQPTCSVVGIFVVG